MPEIFPNKWIEGEVENYETVMSSLNAIAREMDVTVGSPFEELGSAKGAFYYGVEATNKGHIALNPRNSELQNVKTMIHELAHAKLHAGNKGLKMSAEEKEFQAEMVAYSTASYFGIDTSDYSLQYLASWTKGKELKDKEQLLREVKETSTEFIEVLEKDLLSERSVSMENTNEQLLENELISFLADEYELDEKVAANTVKNSMNKGEVDLAYTTLGDDEQLEIQAVLNVKENQLIKSVYGEVISEKEVVQFKDKEELLS